MSLNGNKNEVDKIDIAITTLISAVNKHLPRNSRYLLDMLKEEYPTIKAKDGNEYIIERKELEFIASYLNDDELKDFPIPILLEMCDIGGKTLVYIRNKKHADFIKRAFGFDRFVNGVLVLETYEMGKIRRKLKTATQVMFNVLE